MNTYTVDLAAPFLQAHHELLALVEGCSAAQWQAIPATEQRAVGMVAYHVACGYRAEIELVNAVVAGQPLPAIYLDKALLDQFNADDAAQHHGCAREEVIALLHAQAAATVAAIHGLNEEALSRTAHVPILAPYFGDSVSVRQLVEGLLPTHIQMHLSEIRAAIGAVDCA